MSADRAPVRHVGVAAFIVDNNPETMERSRRLFPTSIGWCVGHAASFDQNPSCCLSCPRPAEVGLIRLGRLKVPNSGKFGRAGSAGRDDCRCCVLPSHDVKEPAGWAEREQNPAYRPLPGALEDAFDASRATL